MVNILFSIRARKKLIIWNAFLILKEYESNLLFTFLSVRSRVPGLSGAVICYDV
jgi:hypothetical protein